MRLSLIAAGVVIVASSIGCSELTSPTSPTSGPIGGAGLPEVVGGRAAATIKVPFNGRLEGAFTFVPDPPPSLFATVRLEATGHATDLGRFTVAAPHRVNLATVTATGTFEFTAASGDRLTADFTGAGTPTETPGVFSIVETATITGGTGRFAGSTGSFIVHRSVDLTTLLTTGSFEGTISSPGAGTP